MAGERTTGELDVAAALRAVGSPLTVGSVALLALNDHVLKQAWPGWVTGKLSDVAGLVVAPVLLALVLTLLRVPRPAWVAVLATGAGFTWVKTTQAGADLASAAWTQVWGSSVVLRDPTDLLALPALAVAWRVLALARRERPTVRRRVAVATGALVLPFAVVATAATSCDPDEGVRSLRLVDRSAGTPPARTGRERMALVDDDEAMRLVTVDGRLHPLGDRGLRQLGAAWGHEERACAADRLRCWRVADASTVQVSVDGGRTWADDLVLDAEERERALAGREAGCGDEPSADLAGLVVVDHAGSVLVVVGARHTGIWLGGPGEEDWRREAAPLSTGPALPGGRSSRFRLLDPDPPYRPVRPDGTEVEPRLPCRSPSPTTVTPHPRNGPPTTYEVCP